MTFQHVRPGPFAAAQFVSKAQTVRAAFAQTSAAIDATNTWPASNYDLLKEQGFHALRVPEKWGGLAPDSYEDMVELVLIQLELAAGEAGTAHVWHQYVMSRDMFEVAQLPDATKHQLAHEILKEGAGICAPISEAGRVRYAMNSTCRPGQGGVFFRGNKKYATGSHGARYALIAANWEEEGVARDGLHFGLIRLDSEGVTNHQDWSVMGQRSTASHSFSYDDVFVPDGWHWHVDPAGGRTDWTGSTVLGLVAQLFFTTAILGCGFGALDQVAELVRTNVRPLDPAWNSAAEDPGIKHHFGRYSASLAGARAMLLEAADAFVAHVRGEIPRSTASLKMMQAKIVCTDAALDVSSDMFRSCGATAATSPLGLDRFWRNARTISLQDPIDVKYRHIGDWILNGVEPPMGSIT